MKDQKIFRINGYGNISAIATTNFEGKVWVRYYDGLEVIETMYSGGVQSKFILDVESEIRTWSEENGYTLWSY